MTEATHEGMANDNVKTPTSAEPTVAPEAAASAPAAADGEAGEDTAKVLEALRLENERLKSIRDQALTVIDPASDVSKARSAFHGLLKEKGYNDYEIMQMMAAAENPSPPSNQPSPVASAASDDRGKDEVDLLLEEIFGDSTMDDKANDQGGSKERGDDPKVAALMGMVKSLTNEVSRLKGDMEGSKFQQLERNFQESIGSAISSSSTIQKILQMHKASGSSDPQRALKMLEDDLSRTAKDVLRVRHTASDDITPREMEDAVRKALEIVEGRASALVGDPSKLAPHNEMDSEVQRFLATKPKPAPEYDGTVDKSDLIEQVRDWATDRINRSVLEKKGQVAAS